MSTAITVYTFNNRWPAGPVLKRQIETVRNVDFFSELAAEYLREGFSVWKSAAFGLLALDGAGRVRLHWTGPPTDSWQAAAKMVMDAGMSPKADAHP